MSNTRIREADAARVSEGEPKVEKSRAPGMKKLHKQLTELYQTIGITVVTPIDRLGGMLVFERAESLADTWVDLAEREPRVKRAIERLLEGSAWTGVLVAHGAIILPVLVNRGLFPDNVANGTATVTMLQNPNLAPYFDHPRFQQQPQEEANGNGHSGD